MEPTEPGIGAGEGSRRKAFADVPSQIVTEAPHLHGRLALWRDRNPDGIAALTYVAGRRVAEPHIRDGYVAYAETPTASWEAGRDGGGLSVLSFVALWNERVAARDGLRFSLRIEDPAAASIPWVSWHPSGMLQAVRFDVGKDLFVRRILYPFCEPLVAEAADGRR